MENPAVVDVYIFILLKRLICCAMLVHWRVRGKKNGRCEWRCREIPILNPFLRKAMWFCRGTCLSRNLPIMLCSGLTKTIGEGDAEMSMVKSGSLSFQHVFSFKSISITRYKLNVYLKLKNSQIRNIRNFPISFRRPFFWLAKRSFIG